MHELVHVNSLALFINQKLLIMKKMLLVFAVAGMAIGLTSCKKDYTCECCSLNYYTSQIECTDYSAEFKKEGDADSWCYALGFGQDCELK